jgi:DNA-binding transcriptional ArsR family regulator
MGLTKTENYTETQVDLARMTKVLGHPARIAILQSIIKTNACVCGDLVTEIGLAQSTISQHLKELKSAGLIKGTIEGTSMCYCIDHEVWHQLQNELLELFNSAICKDDDCC